MNALPLTTSLPADASLCDKRRINEPAVSSDKRWVFAMQSAGVAPANEDGVVIKQEALLNPGLPRPNSVAPTLKKFAMTSSMPA